MAFIGPICLLVLLPKRHKRVNDEWNLLWSKLNPSKITDGTLYLLSVAARKHQILYDVIAVAASGNNI